MKKRLLALMLAVVMTVGMTGCGGGNTAKDTQGSSKEATTTNTKGGGSTDLNVMIETGVESLDPQQATDGTSFEVIADFTDGLMQMDKDGKPIPAIAESYEVSEDGLTYTFKLRDDAKWSNGDDVTAADFVYGWQRAVDPAVASEYAYMLSDIGQVVNAADIIAGNKDKSELGVTAVDDKTLEVKLNVPVSYFLSLMYFPTFYPINQKFFEECGDKYATSADTLLSNGAFIVDEFEPAATAFHLTKNEDYYGAADVSLTGLSYQVIQDSQTALMSYQNGDLDITLVNGDQVDQVSDDEAFQSIGAGYLWYVSPNISAVKELQNKNIRLALSLAMNRETITSEVLKDGSLPTYTAIPREFASDFSKDQEQFKDFCRDDAETATELWEKGLKELGTDTVELEMIVDDDDAPKKVATVLKEQWETALKGLTVTITTEPKKQRVNDMQEGNYEIGLTRWGPDYDDPMTYLGMWITDNSNNYGLWSNSDYDAIIAECTTGDLCTELDARRDRLYDAEKIVMEDAVIFPIYTQANAEMVSPNVKGIEFHPVALNRVYKNTVKTTD
ncbi:oligopeptide transport system substrate-binding protein [Acetitomaculum ruminis DSM 5522]|uniref:Oligopeptide transport system substrate-binding protein n=1 Tax=Acetitomaculum ruminis DSM 5522 TaxID=1120918 RepID=A0A1I0XTY2_9FIRM|nr:peptide ABC transporter substrate-binding protein [Acetitomaculum ruminis]SFB04461.1 oligopeptide transport system substrate-binding protein [Acetitomaculum ruminis DSM 5522]